jgi:hypothetical protein
LPAVTARVQTRLPDPRPLFLFPLYLANIVDSLYITAAFDLFPLVCYFAGSVQFLNQSNLNPGVTTDFDPSPHAQSGPTEKITHTNQTAVPQNIFATLPSSRGQQGQNKPAPIANFSERSPVYHFAAPE